MTNKMAHDNGCHGTWLLLEILPYDPSMWFYSHLISVSLHKVSLLWVLSVSKFSLLIRTPVILEGCLPWWPHFYLITSVKTLSPNKFTFWGTEGLGLQSINLRGYISTHNTHMYTPDKFIHTCIPMYIYNHTYTHTFTHRLTTHTLTHIHIYTNTPTHSHSYTHSHILEIQLDTCTLVHPDYLFLHTDLILEGICPFSHSASQGHCHLRQQCDLSQGKQTLHQRWVKLELRKNPLTLWWKIWEDAYHATVGILS